MRCIWAAKLFNARMNAANFSDAEMKEAIAYAHLRGVRLYITMNTLIREIPAMTSEHCFIRDPEPGKRPGFHTNKGETGRYSSETGCYFLKDRKGQLYPVLTDPSDGRSLILSHKETDLAVWKEALKKAGIHRFRVYLNDGVNPSL